MIELVTLDQAKAYCQVVNQNQHDTTLTTLIRSASRALLGYLRLDESVYLNSDGAMEIDSDTLGYSEVPEEVQGAVLYLVGVVFRDPDGVEMEKWQQGYLPFPVINMVYHLRDPAIA